MIPAFFRKVKTAVNDWALTHAGGLITDLGGHLLIRVMFERNGLGGAFSPSQILLIKFLGQPHTRGAEKRNYEKFGGQSID